MENSNQQDTNSSQPPAGPRKVRVFIRLQTSELDGTGVPGGDAEWEFPTTVDLAGRVHFQIVRAVAEAKELRKAAKRRKSAEPLAPADPLKKRSAWARLLEGFRSA